MSTRRTRKRSNTLDRQQNDTLNKEMRRRKAELFIQQFENEAQCRINEMVSKMDRMLETVDRVFKVELMKMPLSLQNTLMRDIIAAENTSAGDVTIAMQTESPETTQPLTRKSSKRVKVRDGVTRETNQQAQSRKTQAEPRSKKGDHRARSLVTSSSTGSLSYMFRSATTTISSKRTKQRVAKISDPPAQSTSRAALLSASDQQLSCSMDCYSPRVTISTSEGMTLCLSAETDVELLDHAALIQIQRLKKLVDYLASKVSSPGV